MGEKKGEKMSKRKRRPDVIDKLLTRKSLLIRAAVQSESLEYQKELEKGAELCDVKIMRFNQRRKSLVRRTLDRILESILIAFLVLFATGCLENTMTGAGRMIQGTGEFIGGIGKDIARGSAGYGNEK